MKFGEASRLLRKAMGWTWETEEGKALSALKQTFHWVTTENNALRRNNERLTRENADLLKRVREAEASARTGQTMAAHWRLKAEPQSGDYDATQEEKQ